MRQHKRAACIHPSSGAKLWAAHSTTRRHAAGSPPASPTPFSESVLTASNQGMPAIHLKESDVSESYKDLVARFLGEDKPMRFVDAVKPGFFKRLFAGR